MNAISYTYNIIQRCALVIAFAGSALCAWAEGEEPEPTSVYVAQIEDGDQYETLQAAINAATDGQTIKLIGDVSLGQTVLITKNITIDGAKEGEGNYTITSSVTNTLGAFYINSKSCNFNIKNVTIDGNGTGTMAVCAYRGVADSNGTISTVEHTGNSGNIISLTNCTVQKFKGWTGSYVGAVYGFSQSTVNLTNCTFTDNSTSQSNDTNSASGADVWVGAAGKLNISGGSLSEVFANTNSTDEVTVTISNNATVAELSVCVSYKEDGSTYIPSITIDNAKVEKLVTEVADTPIPANAVKLVNGGTITNECATEVAKIFDGKNTKAFSSLTNAIEAASTAETTITILADVSGDISVASGKNVKLSVGEHTLSGNITCSGTLTITDGTFTGTITCSGILTITDGTFTGTITKGTDGTVAISGGTFSTIPPASCCAGNLPIKNADGKYNLTNSWEVKDNTQIDASHFEYLNSGEYTVATATYTRNAGMIGAGSTTGTKYGTICLPFSITAAPTDVKFYTATGISNGALIMTEVAPTADAPISAATPLIFELTTAAATLTITSNNATVNTTAPATNTATDNILIGTFAEQTINSGLGDIYYLNGDAFHQAQKSLKVPAYRAYLKVTPSSARPRVLSIAKDGDEATGITASDALDTVTEVYDLNGRKQNALQHGINIMRRADGITMKVMVK